MSTFTDPTVIAAALAGAATMGAAWFTRNVQKRHGDEHDLSDGWNQLARHFRNEINDLKTEQHRRDLECDRRIAESHADCVRKVSALEEDVSDIKQREYDCNRRLSALESRL